MNLLKKKKKSIIKIQKSNNCENNHEKCKLIKKKICKKCKNIQIYIPKYFLCKNTELN